MAKSRIILGHSALLGLALLCLLLAGAAEPQAREQSKQPDNRPAGEVYKNLQLFQKMPASQLDRVMETLNKMLGVECTHCHIQDQWAREDVEAKQTARKMFRMIGAIAEEHFDGKFKVACWTCHRGSTEPSTSWPEGTPFPAVPDPSPFVQEDKPAGEVYKNIKVFNRMPARRLETVMRVMRLALGVECSHCHVEGDWASDEKEPKQTVRKMFAMRGAIQRTHFEGENKLSCWTCHRGSTKPETSPAK